MSLILTRIEQIYLLIKKEANMHLFKMHKNIYKLSNYACTQELLNNEIKERKKILGDWELLRSRKVPDKEIAKIKGCSIRYIHKVLARSLKKIKNNAKN